MKVADIKKRAKELGITCGKMKKTELIHSIQRAEGNNTCYGTSNGQCGNTDCCFIEDCPKIKI